MNDNEYMKDHIIEIQMKDLKIKRLHSLKCQLSPPPNPQWARV